MPQIDLIPVRFYQPTDPYNHIIDNQPLSDIETQIELINFQVDLDANTLREAIGSQGTLANRLAQSINDDGSLKTVAIDNALHSIAAHLDEGGFVRMTLGERAKLSNIDDGSTDVSLRFNTISGIVAFTDGIVDFQPSDTISWRFQSGSLFADSTLPVAVRHIHHYGITAIPQNLLTPDFTNYKTTSVATPYQTGSLRVYVNGIRLSENFLTNVPVWNGTSFNHLPLSYSEGVDVGGVVISGLFSLSAAINSSIEIITDFDVIY